MKSKRLLSIMVCLIFSCTASLYAQENGGFLQTLKNRFKKEQPKVETQKLKSEAKIKASTPAPTVMPKPQVKAAAPAASPAVSGRLKPPPPMRTMEDKKPLKDMTEKELAAFVTDALNYHPEVLDFINDVKKKEDAKGAPSYYYVSGGKETLLSDLDKDTLIKILDRVNTEAARIQADRVAKQMEQIQRQNMQIQQINQQNLQLQQQRNIIQAQRAAQVTVPQPPKIYTPPTVAQAPSVPRPPSVPSAPPSVPRAPSVPSGPPRR